MCWITTGRDARGYIVFCSMVLNLGGLWDLILLVCDCLRLFWLDLISTINHYPGLFKPRTCGRRFLESCSVGTGNLFVCNCRPLCIVSSTYDESRPALFWQWRDWSTADRYPHEAGSTDVLTSGEEDVRVMTEGLHSVRACWLPFAGRECCLGLSPCHTYESAEPGQRSENTTASNRG